MTASTALITGASAGIGCELAKLFGRDRYNPVLVARNRDRLEQFATELQTQFGISARAVALDLTAPSAPPLLFDQLQRDGVHVDILVNNPATASRESLQQEILGQIQLNITTLTLLTRSLHFGTGVIPKPGAVQRVRICVELLRTPADRAVLRVTYSSKFYR